MLWAMGGQTEVKTTAEQFDFLLSSWLRLFCSLMGWNNADISEILWLIFASLRAVDKCKTVVFLIIVSLLFSWLQYLIFQWVDNFNVAPILHSVISQSELGC